MTLGGEAEEIKEGMELRRQKQLIKLKPTTHIKGEKAEEQKQKGSTIRRLLFMELISSGSELSIFI